MNDSLQRAIAPMRSLVPPEGKFLLVALAVVYIFFFRLVYIQDIVPVWTYMGITYTPPTVTAELMAWIFALVPSLLLKPSLTRPSQFILTLLYICVYIPSIFVPLYIRFQPEFPLIVLGFTLLVGFCTMILFLDSDRTASNDSQPASWQFWFVLWGLYLLGSIWIIAVFRGSLRLVAFSDVYTSGLRFESRSIFDQSNVGFAVMMLYGSVNPFLMALGLQTRKLPLTIAGIAGQLLCYSTGGLKAILLSVGIMLLLHFVVRKHMRRAAQTLLTLSILLLLAFHFSVHTLGLLHPATLTLSGFVERAVVTPGQLTAEYQDFFVNHSHLHLAETKPFSWFLSDPLPEPVINAVSRYYIGDGDLTSNASFWAQDGLANFGLAGILGVSLLTAAVMRAMDRASAQHDPCFSSIVFCVAGSNLANGPLSTAMLSGGLILSIGLIWLLNPAIAARVDRRKNLARELPGPGVAAPSPQVNPQ